jgi:hypothetical protein
VTARDPLFVSGAVTSPPPTEPASPRRAPRRRIHRWRRPPRHHVRPRQPVRGVGDVHDGVQRRRGAGRRRPVRVRRRLRRRQRRHRHRHHHRVTAVRLPLRRDLPAVRGHRTRRIHLHRCPRRRPGHQLRVTHRPRRPHRRHRHRAGPRALLGVPHRHRRHHHPGRPVHGGQGRRGAVPVATEQSAATAYESFLGYRLDTNLLEYHNGSEWATAPRRARDAREVHRRHRQASQHHRPHLGKHRLSATAAITNPSAARSLLCDVQYTAWLSASGALSALRPPSGAVTAVPSGTALPPTPAPTGARCCTRTPPPRATRQMGSSPSVTVTVPAGGTVTVTIEGAPGLRDRHPAGQLPDAAASSPIRYL